AFLPVVPLRPGRRGEGNGRKTPQLRQESAHHSANSATAQRRITGPGISGAGDRPSEKILERGVRGGRPGREDSRRRCYLAGRAGFHSILLAEKQRAG